jgi:hypothetical protein
MKNLIAGILMIALCWSCGGDETPDDILPEDKFAVVYADVMLADGVIDIELRKDKKFHKKGMRFYKEIFEKHNTNWKQFDKSLSFYMDDPERMGVVLGKVLQELNKKESTLAPDMSKPVTTDIIEVQKMILVLLDVPNIKAIFERVITSAKAMTAEELKACTIVFQKHNVTREQFKSSFAHYGNNEAQFKAIYDEVLRQLTTLEKVMSDTTGNKLPSLPPAK